MNRVSFLSLHRRNAKQSLDAWLNLILDLSFDNDGIHGHGVIQIIIYAFGRAGTLNNVPIMDVSMRIVRSECTRSYVL